MNKPIRLIHSLVICLVVCAGCTTTYHVDDPDRDFAALLNERGMRAKGRVHLSDGSSPSARGLRLEADTLFYAEPQRRGVPQRDTRVLRSDVDVVQFVSRGKGALEGLGIGIAAGAVFGFVTGALEAHDDCLSFLDFSCGSPTNVGLGYAAIFGTIGALVGPVVGLILGKKTKFKFQPVRTD